MDKRKYAVYNYILETKLVEMSFQSLGTFDLVSGRKFAKLIAELQLSKEKYLNVRLTRSWLDKETQDFVEPVFTNLLTVDDLKEL